MVYDVVIEHDPTGRRESFYVSADTADGAMHVASGFMKYDETIVDVRPTDQPAPERAS